MNDHIRRLWKLTCARALAAGTSRRSKKRRGAARRRRDRRGRLVPGPPGGLPQRGHAPAAPRAPGRVQEQGDARTGVDAAVPRRRRRGFVCVICAVVVSRSVALGASSLSLVLQLGVAATSRTACPFRGRVAATPRLPRGYFVEAGRGDVAATTCVFRFQFPVSLRGEVLQRRVRLRNGERVKRSIRTIVCRRVGAAAPLQRAARPPQRRAAEPARRPKEWCARSTAWTRSRSGRTGARAARASFRRRAGRRATGAISPSTTSSSDRSRARRARRRRRRGRGARIVSERR